MPSIGLVLGAGGIAGFAYHLGALGALADATGWDPRRADLIVGTSAGANLGASLRAGLSIEDHVRRTCGGEVSPEGALLGRYRSLEELEIPDRPPFRPADLLRPTAPWLVLPAFFPPFPWRLGLLLGLAPAGRVSTGPLADRVRDLTTEDWPEPPTWVVAARLRDGRRVVFGRDDVQSVDLARAVEASSAVPGYLTPVRIGSRRYMDGAVISPTNADLVAPLAFDLVVVVSPMSAAEPDGWGGRSGERNVCRRILARELAVIRSKGTPVLVIEPTAEDADAMGEDYMEHVRARRITETALATTARQLEDPATDDLLRLLRSTAAAVVS